jgi:hypothetical protein
MTDVIDLLSASSDEDSQRLDTENGLVITGYTAPALATPLEPPLTTNRRRSHRRTNQTGNDSNRNTIISTSSNLAGSITILSTATASTSVRRSGRIAANRSRRRRRSRRNIFDNLMINFFNYNFDEEDPLDYEQALDIASRLGNAKPGGLTRLEMANLPKRPHLGVDADCTICLETIKKDNPTIVLDACGHLFHEACAIQWLKIKAECPSCRGKVKTTMVL